MAQICSNPKCRASNSDQAQFCNQCGQRLTATSDEIRCPQCNSPLQPGTSACKSCGASLTAVPDNAGVATSKDANSKTVTAHPPTGPGAYGGGLGMIASLVVLVAFFLPWIQACGVEMSGYDIASSQSGYIAYNWIYWLTLLAGLGCLLLSLASTGLAGNELKTAAWGRFILAGVGALPLLNIMGNLSRMSGGQANQAAQAILETIRIGGWLTLAGLVGIIVSAMMDMGRFPPAEPDSS